MSGFVHEDLPTVEVDRREELKRPLTETVRDLVDATIRTTVADDEVRAVHEELEELVARLRASQLLGSAGGRYNSERRAWHWGNAVIGAHNAIAPPMTVVHDEPGRAHADIELGAAYELSLIHISEPTRPY